MKHQYDVIIVGAGLAGLRAAVEIQLQKRDHHPNQSAPALKIVTVTSQIPMKNLQQRLEYLIGIVNMVISPLFKLPKNFSVCLSQASQLLISSRVCESQRPRYLRH